MFSILQAFAQIAPAITCVILMLSLVAAVFSVRFAWRNVKSSQLSHIYTRIIEHNKMIYDNEYRQIAINIFHDLETPELAKKREQIEKQEDGYFMLYWATRSVHLSHILLLAQVWVLCDEDIGKLRRLFPGWLTFSRKVLRDMDVEMIGRSNKPQWYKKACGDFNLRDNESIFGQKFQNMCRELQK